MGNNVTVPDYRTAQEPRTSIACDAARRVTRGAAYLFPPGFFAVVGFFVGRFVAGVFFGLVAFRVTLGGVFAIFTAGFIAFAIGIAPGFEGIKISSVTSPAHTVEHLSSCSVVTHANYSYEYSGNQGAEVDRLPGPIKNPVSCFTHACDT